MFSRDNQPRRKSNGYRNFWNLFFSGIVNIKNQEIDTHYNDNSMVDFYFCSLRLFKN